MVNGTKELLFATMAAEDDFYEVFEVMVKGAAYLAIPVLRREGNIIVALPGICQPNRQGVAMVPLPGDDGMPTEDGEMPVAFFEVALDDCGCFRQVDDTDNIPGSVVLFGEDEWPAAVGLVQAVVKMPANRVLPLATGDSASPPGRVVASHTASKAAPLAPPGAMAKSSQAAPAMQPVATAAPRAPPGCSQGAVR